MTGLTRKSDEEPKKKKPKRKLLPQQKAKGLRHVPNDDILLYERALNLRLAGMTYGQIAKTLGVKDRHRIGTLIERAIGSRIQEPTDLLRKIEVERFDAMLLSLATKVRAGDVQAIDRALKISAERRKLLGLDMAEKKDIGGTVEFQWRIDERRGHDSDPGPPALSEAESLR